MHSVNSRHVNGLGLRHPSAGKKKGGGFKEKKR